MEGATSYDRDVESLKATELRLGLPGTDEESSGAIRRVKRTLDEANEDGRPVTNSPDDAADPAATTGDEVAPPKSKTQVVGWPPVRSYRKNTFQARRPTEAAEPASGTLVKVSMDGAPYLRKVELKTYKGYEELREALESMFGSFSLGKISAAEGRSAASEEYAVTYEDKDGDWMLVGDVPWGMFTSSCKRLRIMRGTEARGFGSNR